MRAGGYHAEVRSVTDKDRGLSGEGMLTSAEATDTAEIKRQIVSSISVRLRRRFRHRPLGLSVGLWWMLVSGLSLGFGFGYGLRFGQALGRAHSVARRVELAQAGVVQFMSASEHVAWCDDR